MQSCWGRRFFKFYQNISIDSQVGAFQPSISVKNNIVGSQTAAAANVGVVIVAYVARRDSSRIDAVACTYWKRL